MPLSLLLKLFVGSLEVLKHALLVVLSSAFVRQSLLKLAISRLLVIDLTLVVLHVSLEFHNALTHRNLLIFEARDFPLKLSLVRLLVICDALESYKFFVDLITLV